jgi:hypothetical protein
MWILCEKVAKENIQVRFFQDDIWQAVAEFIPPEVFKQAR